MKPLALALGLAAITQILPAQTGAGPRLVVGYYQNGNQTPAALKTIDCTKITHLNLAFENPTNDAGDLSYTPFNDTLIALAHKNHIKVLVSIGGGGASTNPGTQARYFDLQSAPKRQAFIEGLLRYVETHKFDGIDVDLEGPAIGKDYGPFIDALTKTFQKRSKLVTAAVSEGYGGDQIPSSCLNEFDFINVMAYDATGPWNPNKPGQHSSFDLAKESVGYWAGRGLKSSKLVLGVPFYGYGFGAAFNQDGYTFAQLVAQYPGAEKVNQVGSQKLMRWEFTTTSNSLS
jgi:GH18 family chitinase